LERYRVAQHAYPPSLDNLAPEFLRAVPIDCTGGGKLRYRLKPDGTYRLYSVGEDWVWPRPATAEEMQAYEDQQSKSAKPK
jgi:hypothetical protein